MPYFRNLIVLVITEITGNSVKAMGHKWGNMKSFRLKNFKSFKDTGEVEIKPITVFVGKNNSGKSSLLRFLPLLKQTLLYNVNTPLLFYGGIIDFGNFDETSFMHGKESISFYLKFDSLKNS